MTVFKVRRRIQVEEDSFFIEVDTTDLDEEFVVVNGPKQTDQLQNLLIKANSRGEVIRGPRRVTWLITVASDDEVNSPVVGTLEFTKKFYAEVAFTVKHCFTRLVEVSATNEREAAGVLSNNLDDDVPDIIESLSDELYATENIESLECEVLKWAMNPEALTLSHSKPVKVYTQED